MGNPGKLGEYPLVWKACGGVIQLQVVYREEIMSKRKPKKLVTKPLHQTGGDIRRVGTVASQSLHDIRVSMPILVIVQKLSNNKVFREEVLKLYYKH